MPRTVKQVNNFTGGEVSPLLFGRNDLPVVQKAMQICLNYIVQPQGGVRRRPGTKAVKHTRLNRFAVFIPFQFSDQQSYLIEATEFYFRFYKDEGIVLETAKNITGATKASPGVITSNSHGFSNGNEVYISNVGGMTQLNGKYFLVAGVTTNTFTLTNLDGTPINTSSYGTYTSGGSVARVYEIATPYAEDTLESLQWSQNADTMYLTTVYYEQRVLTRTGHTSWTLAVPSLTSSPFSLSTKTITGITNASPGVFTTAIPHGYVENDVVNITSVVGMTELNNRVYKVNTTPSTTTFTLKTLSGTALDTTSFGVWSSGGTLTIANDYPKCCSFSDSGRLFYAYTRRNPETIWGSRAPSGSTTRYNDFTTGVDPTHAVIFTLAPVLGKADAIQALTNTSRSLVALTYSTIRRIYGATESESVTPSAVTARPVNSVGCADTLPISNGSTVFYVQRGGKAVRSLEYDISVDGYTTVDRNIVAEHVTAPGVLKIVSQQGSPDVYWVLVVGGTFAGLTYKEREDISAWHRQQLGGQHINSNNTTMPYGKVLSIGIMPRSSKSDQVWFIVERRINGQTRRTVEFMSDWILYPKETSFFTSPDNKESDKLSYKNALYEAQKDAVSGIDLAHTYDGSIYGTAAGATVTPGAVSGDTVTFTASANVFTSEMVGREIWKKYDEKGNGGGRARIKEYFSGTSVDCEILSDFNDTSAIPASSWFLSATSISGLDMLEGCEVDVIIDGGISNRKTVSNGAITLDVPASKAHIGLPYASLLVGMNIDTGGQSGPATSQPRNVIKAALRFEDTAEVFFGTDPYDLEQIPFREQDYLFGRPPQLFRGIKEIHVNDDWLQNEKKMVLLQTTPGPCTFLGADLYVDTTDE